MNLTATCFTEKHGIHKVRIKSDVDGNLPDYVAVPIPNNNDDLKFDPRKDWDNWIQTGTTGIPDLLIKTTRIVGTIYMENLPIKRATPTHQFITQYNAHSFKNPSAWLRIESV